MFCELFSSSIWIADYPSCVNFWSVMNKVICKWIYTKKKESSFGYSLLATPWFLTLILVRVLISIVLKLAKSSFVCVFTINCD